ncbi:hypothetical protein MHTCC0001_35070 [Flavobacteriaceae bacterium MHTCC 0001]
MYFYSSLVVCGEIQDKQSGKSSFGNPASKKFYRTVMINNREFYYVSNSLMKRIKRSIKLNNCENIKIEKLKKINSSDIKIIRHQYY